MCREEACEAKDCPPCRTTCPGSSDLCEVRVSSDDHRPVVGSSSIFDTEAHEGPREARRGKREAASACVKGRGPFCHPSGPLGHPGGEHPVLGELTARPTRPVTTYRLSRGAGSSSASETPSSSSSLETSPAGGHSTDALQLSLEREGPLRTQGSQPWRRPARPRTCGDDTVHVACLVLLAEEVGSGGFQLFVVAGHYCHVVDLVGSQPLCAGRGSEAVVRG